MDAFRSENFYPQKAMVVCVCGYSHDVFVTPDGQFQYCSKRTMLRKILPAVGAKIVDVESLIMSGKTR